MLPRSRTMLAVALATAALVTPTWTTSASPAEAAGRAPITNADTGAGADDGADDQPTTVSLQLAAPDADRLAAVAGRRIVDRQARLQKLSNLVPDAEQHLDVADDLRERGFTIDGQSTWSITATAPESVVTQTFGASSVTTAEGELPDVPDSLAPDVDVVLPADAPALAHPLATGQLNGTDVRRADAPASVAPSAGANDSGLTIATLQLATWNTSDYTTYAASQGFADPVASGQYRAVAVDGGPTNANGTQEVALDQESLLSVAPSARQAAYFAPNTLTGFSDALARVYADATGAGATPDAHLAALSISWGQCETGWGASAIAMLQTRLAALVGAGVTVFAATGDSGIYDCHTTTNPTYRTDVDFPASSPFVVAVGATNLSAATSAANTGSNWIESAWSCTTRSGCVGAGGTGGGISGSGGVFVGFDKPSWQNAASNAPFATKTKRMVPDIAADGDPSTGFAVYTGGAWAQYGGTSLSAPLSAGQLVNTLGDVGRTAGVGDIHPALYQAYSATRGLAATDPHQVFRDVVSGSNGAVADAGADPSVTTTAGYDTVSGLGGVLWAALAPYLGLPYDATVVAVATGPTSGASGGTNSGGASRITASASLDLSRAAQTGRVKARWKTAVTGGTLASATVEITTGGKFVYRGTKGSGSAHFRARAGRTYVLSIVSRDNAGHVARRTVRLHVPTSAGRGSKR